MTVDTPFASPPRISILVSDLSKQGAGRWGGGAVRTFLLAQALERLGAQVTIYGFIFGDDPAEPTVGNFPHRDGSWGLLSGVYQAIAGVTTALGYGYHLCSTTEGNDLGTGIVA